MTLDAIQRYLQRFEQPDLLICEVSDFTWIVRAIQNNLNAEDLLHRAVLNAGAIHSWQGHIAFALLVAAEHLMVAARHILMQAEPSYI